MFHRQLLGYDDICCDAQRGSQVLVSRWFTQNLIYKEILNSFDLVLVLMEYSLYSLCLHCM